MPKRLIGVLLIDTIASMKDFEDIILGLLKQGFSLEIALRREEGVESSWQVIIHKYGS